MSAPTVYATRLPVSHPAFPRGWNFTDQDSVHKFVMRLFPKASGGGDARSQFNILYSLQTPTNGEPNLHIQSTVAPNLVKDGDGYGARVADVTSVLERVRSSNTARIHADMNTVRRVRSMERRVPVEDVPAWLLARLDGSVYSVQPLDVTELGRQRHGKRMHVTRIVADVEIADHDAFIRFLIEGVGRGKSYGCGLLLAAPTL